MSLYKLQKNGSFSLCVWSCRFWIVVRSCRICSLSFISHLLFGNQSQDSVCNLLLGIVEYLIHTVFGNLNTHCNLLAGFVVDLSCSPNGKHPFVHLAFEGCVYEKVLKLLFLAVAVGVFCQIVAPVVVYVSSFLRYGVLGIIEGTLRICDVKSSGGFW